MAQSSDRLGLLATFIRVAECKSLSAAARDLGLSQASVSRQLKALEDTLGVQLAHRTTHALTLTEAGEACLGDARALLGEWEGLSERAAAATRTMAGNLSVVAPVGLGQTLIADGVSDFIRTYPDMDVKLVLDDAPIRFSEVGCDVWIRVGPIPDDTLIVRPLAHLERRLYAAPQVAAALPNATRPDATLPDATRPDAGDPPPKVSGVAMSPYEGQTIPLHTKGGGRHDLALNARIETNNIFTARRATISGAGVCVLPVWLVKEDVAAGRLINVWPDWAAASLTAKAAYAPTSRTTRRVQTFNEHLSDWLTQSVSS